MTPPIPRKYDEVAGKRLSLRIPERLSKALKKLAKAEQQSVNYIVVDMLQRGVGYVPPDVLD